MRLLTVFRFRARSRRSALLLLAACGVMSLGARCIERPSVHVDKDGYTHLTGRLVNDTDIQGVDLTLRGTLYDAAGNVIAQKDDQPCPPDLSPQSEVMFDIRFDNPGVPPHASFDARLVAGRALSEPLPSPDVVVFLAEAIRFEGIPPIPGLPITDADVLFSFSARNRSANTYNIQGCAIVIDNQGQVIASVDSELTELDGAGNIVPASMEPSAYPGSVFMIAKDVPQGPVQVKAWLWFANKGARTSAYQYVATELFTIQTETIR